MLLELLIVIVLALHLMCVNVAAAGPLVCLWLDWRGGRGDALAARIGRWLCWKSLALLLVGGGLGLLLGLLHWDDGYREVLGKFPSKIYYGVWELVFSLVLIVATAVLWRFAPQAKSARWGRAVLLLLTGTNLLYHFPFLFAIISRVHSGAATPDGIVDAAVFRGLMMEDSVLPQAVHFAFASFAMVGITLIGFALWMERARGASDSTTTQPADAAAADGPTATDAAAGRAPADGDSDHAISTASDLGYDAQRITAWGARLALVATLCQIPVGMWLVVKLAPGAQRQVMGADLIATGLLGVSIILSLGLLHHLSTLALGVPRRKTIIVAMAMMAALIILMTGVLQRI